jgi:hypothetical protein
VASDSRIVFSCSSASFATASTGDESGGGSSTSTTAGRAATAGDDFRPRLRLLLLRRDLRVRLRFLQRAHRVLERLLRGGDGIGRVGVGGVVGRAAVDAQISRRVGVHRRLRPRASGRGDDDGRGGDRLPRRCIDRTVDPWRRVDRDRVPLQPSRRPRRRLRVAVRGVGGAFGRDLRRRRQRPADGDDVERLADAPPVAPRELLARLVQQRADDRRRLHRVRARAEHREAGREEPVDEQRRSVDVDVDVLVG